MGIVNLTPDSFSGDGMGSDSRAAIARARALAAEGADLLDLGGESTRPGAAPVGVEEELQRVIPVLRQVLDLGVPISIDTRRARVMREALAVGADVINDVEALRAPGALDAVAASRAGVCLMHMQRTPADMQDDPRYGDVVAEVTAFLGERAQAAQAAGIGRSRIVVDPGFGFGKRMEHNLALLRGLPALRAAGFPVLVGLSRKSVLGQLTGRPVGERVVASVAAALFAVCNGASIVRVHDVAATRDALAVWGALRSK